METNIQATNQIVLIRKVMQIENCGFNTAIDIIDRLKNEDLLDTYLYEMHGAEFEQLRYNEDRQYGAD